MSANATRIRIGVPAVRLLVGGHVKHQKFVFVTQSSLKTKADDVNLSFYRCYSCGKDWKNDPYLIKSPYPDVEIPNIALHQFVWSKIANWENKIATECGETGKKYSYKDARIVTKKLASALQNQFNLKKGDCFAVLLPNIPEYPFFLLAASEAGLVATTINPTYKPYEIAKQLTDCKAKLIVTISNFHANAEGAIKELNAGDIPIVVVKTTPKSEIPKGAVSFDDVIKNSSGAVNEIAFNAEDTVVLPYSSGTTGLPKGVELSHRNITANLAQLGTDELKLLLPTTANQQDIVLGILPMFHIYGMVSVTLTTLSEGAKIVTLPRFDPKLFIKTIYRHKTAVLYIVPPIVLFMGGHPRVKARYLSSIRVVVSGAAPIGHSDMERLKKKVPHIDAVQGYGMTESSPVTFFTHKDRKNKYSSVGVPIPNTIAKIVDVSTGESLPPGKSGELYIRGPQIMKGYLNRPEENASTLVDGWLRTGDLGHYDEEGDLYVTDRLKELIKVKGFQVAPAELEELLREHPQVADAAVIGVTDERSGEVPRGFVVAKEGETLDPKEVAAFVAEKVADYKQLTGGVFVVSAIPKSAAGKILRRELKSQYGDKK